MPKKITRAQSSGCPVAADQFLGYQKARLANDAVSKLIRLMREFPKSLIVLRSVKSVNSRHENRRKCANCSIASLGDVAGKPYYFGIEFLP